MESVFVLPTCKHRTMKEATRRRSIRRRQQQRQRLMTTITTTTTSSMEEPAQGVPPGLNADEMMVSKESKNFSTSHDGNNDASSPAILGSTLHHGGAAEATTKPEAATHTRTTDPSSATDSSWTPAAAGTDRTTTLSSSAADDETQQQENLHQDGDDSSVATMNHGQDRSDDDVDVSAEDGMSEYELLRRAKIARNEAVLRELGLLDPNLVDLGSQQPNPRRRRRRSTKRARDHGMEEDGQGEDSNEVSSPVEPPRRSQRLQEVATTTTTKPTVSPLEWNELDLPKRRKFPRRAHGVRPPPLGELTGNGSTFTRDALARSNVDSYTPIEPDPNSCILSIMVSPLPSSCASSMKKPPATQYPPNSARAIRLNVPRLVSTFLGRTMAEAGKAHVMMKSARTASSAKFETISFNKYSGVQEWANAAAFLWINVGSPNADVVNEFSHQGRRINWFGGSRMYEHSNTVQNLIAAGTQKRSHRGPFGEKQAFSWSLNDGGGVVLWCRRYTPLRHTFEPYMCLGRLQLVSWDAASHPIEFVWELVDYDKLWDHSDIAARYNFRSLVDSYSKNEEVDPAHVSSG